MTKPSVHTLAMIVANVAVWSMVATAVMIGMVGAGLWLAVSSLCQALSRPALGTWHNPALRHV